jgi:hypothetical protein
MNEYEGKDRQKWGDESDEKDLGKQRVQQRLADALSPLPLAQLRWKALGAEGVVREILESPLE